MQLSKLFKLAFLLVLILSVNACKNDDEDDPVNAVDKSLVKNYGSEAPLEWNTLYLEIERYAGGYRPCPAPRSLGYMGLAAYEACITGMPDYNSMASRYPGLNVPKVETGKEYHWPTVINAVYATLMPEFFPTAKPELISKMTALENTLNAKYESEVAPEVFFRSKDYGKSVAEAFWAWEKTDVVGHDAYKDPFGSYDWQAAWNNTNGKWVATVPGPGRPMYPYWGDVRPFVISSGERLCKPPFPYSTDPKSPFYAQTLEVYNNSNPAQAYELKWIAEFWSDDLINLTFSPGPRWMAIANQVIDANKASLDKSLECYAKTGMALADAAIACWYSKYYYNVERPQSFIQREMDPSWNTTLNNPLTSETGISPSFPAYPSGHSTMGGAGAEAIASVFGYDVAMTDRCHFNRTDFAGTPRSFESLSDMAQENALSRIFLGVHFRMDSEVGVDFGRTIGRKVNKLPWKK